MVLRNHVTIQYYFFSTVINYLGRFLALKSHDSLITYLCKTTWQTKIIISITTTRMATKFSRRVTYLKGLLSKKSHGSWVTHSCKITWQFKNISIKTISILVATKLRRVLTSGKMLRPQTLMPSQIFRFFPFFLLIAVFGRTDKCCSYFFFYFWFRGVWPISDSLTWYTMCFQAMCFRQG